MTVASADTHPLTWRLRADDSASDIKLYEANDGYAAVRQILNNTAPADIVKLIKAAGLRGRGGGGFPAGVKWELMPAFDPNAPKRYLLCNADEMEPSTYKDRLLMEQAPHQLIEGMILAAYAIQACNGYLFLRGEYVLAAERMQKALTAAKEAGYLGKNILGSGWDFELVLHTGAGRYICGEETALINSLEGRRANPRARPPFPQVAGLWGRPTIVNNVETLCNVPHILLRGADWYKQLSQGKSTDAGTKLFGVCGRANKPGLWELPMGTTAREILEQHAGGMQDGYELKAWLPGGVSTDFLLPEHLDTPMDFDSIGKLGSRMGTGIITVVDQKPGIITVLRNIEEFFARESCGWCTPCRDGLPWTVKTLQALEQGKGQPGDIEMLERTTKLLSPGYTFCALAPGAMEPLQSALKYFRAEFEQGIAKT